MKNKNKNKKNLIWLIIIIVILVILSLIFGINYALNRKDQNIINREITLIKKTNNSSFLGDDLEKEYLDIITYNDLIDTFLDREKISKDTSISLEYNNVLLDGSEDITFSLVGENKLKIILETDYNYKNHHEDIISSKEYTILVKDTIYPVINGLSDKTIYVGDSINLVEGITATDEKEGEVSFTVEGSVDTKKAGTYEVLVKATDQNGNVVEGTFKVTVKNKTTSKPNTNNSNQSNNNNSNSSNNNNNNQTQPSGELTAKEKEAQARVIAREIARSITGSTDLEKVTKAAERVSEYYQKGVHKESGVDYRTAYGVFIKGESSCAGTTRALGMVLEEMGYSWTHANENQWTHQWVILTMDGRVGYADGQVGIAGYGVHPIAE